MLADEGFPVFRGFFSLLEMQSALRGIHKVYACLDVASGKYITKKVNLPIHSVVERNLTRGYKISSKIEDVPCSLNW